jgi:ABC-type lipoprotein release transport system permease subunit
MVRLKGGVAALPAFRAQLTRMTGANARNIEDYNAQALRRQSLTAFESRFVLALAAASLVAFCVLIGPLLVRDVAATSARLQVARLLGMTPRQRVAAAAAGPVLAALVAGPASVVGAVLISAFFPVGSAAAYEPTPGILPDWPVLVAGLVLIPAIVLAGSLGAAAWTERPSAGILSTSHYSGVVTALSRIGAPPPIIVGARMALETGRGRSGVPARQALLGTTAGIVGIVTAFVFASGVNEAAGNTRRFGQIFSLGVFPQTERRTPAMERFIATVAKDPDVIAVTDSRSNVATADDARHTPVMLLSVEPVLRTPDIVVVSGRMPRSPGEVALGPESAKEMGATAGSQVVLRGNGAPMTLTLTGLAFVVESWQNSHASGGWVTRDGFDRLFDDYLTAAGFVEIRPGASPSAVQTRHNPVRTDLRADVPSLERGPPPRRLGEIQQIGVLPDALGAFLTLLAIGALAHVLFTTVQRRRKDFAVMRALGMTRRQARTAILTQAIVLAVVGLLFGVPVGLALGRWLWRIFSDYVPLEYAPPPAAGPLVLLVLLAPVAAALLALWPGHQMARLRVHEVLKAE